MTKEQIASIIKDRKGQFFTITVQRPAKTLQGAPNIEKRSEYQGQNCDYANRSPVRTGVEEGNREAPVLPSHIKEVVMIEGVKFWLGHNGQYYFPMPITGNKPKVAWYLENELSTFENVQQFLYASEKTKKPTKEETEEKNQVLFNAIKIENIVSIV